MRPGRLDSLIYIGLPDWEARISIIKATLRKSPVDPEVDYDYLADRTEGFSGADMSALVREATVQALREVQAARKAAASVEAAQAMKIAVTQGHLLWAFRKVRASVSEESRRKYDKMQAKLTQMKTGSAEEDAPSDANSTGAGGQLAPALP